MKKTKIYPLIIALLLAFNVYAQLTNPDPEAVYGGRVRGMDAYALSSGNTRIFVSTQSANSIFFADMSTSGSPTFGSFTAMPGVGDDDGYGGSISQLQAHSASDLLFFVSASKDLLQASTSSSSVTTIVSGGVDAIRIYNPTYLMYTSGAEFHWGTLDAAGAFTEHADSPRPAINTDQIHIDPATLRVYIIDLGTTVTIYESTDVIGSFSATTNFNSINTADLTAAGYSWTAMGFGPDGTIFVGGNDASSKYIAYTEDNGTTWNIISSGIAGVSGSSFAFQGTSSPYSIYFSTCYATFTSGGGFGSWASFGNAGFETHPNDGDVFADPTNASVVYLTTDQGIGVTTNGGSVISEIDDGLEAVQIQDFDMDDSKTTGYAASKSGVRVVTDYSTASPTWTNAIFPLNDGSGYYSAEMAGNNTSQAYVGNVRVYKTTDGGGNWTKVFTAENAPYSFPNVGSQVLSIEVCPDDNNIVLAGYTIDGTDQGGLFYSTDAGSTWDQILCKASSTGNDVDVYDIAFTNEGGNIVAYAGVYYDQTIPIADRGRSIYRCEWDASAGTWSVRQDMDGAYTAVGYPITATIIDLQTSVTGDTLFACGTDAGSNHPIAYYKIFSGSGLWTTFTTSGFPSSAGQKGKAITVGNDTCYVAVDNSIYTLDMTSGTAWTNAYTYPVGTEINVLFYDDLLVGTGTGLYAQNIDGSLPVELTSFTADIVGEKIKLRWNTATEVNNYGFEIERAFDNGSASSNDGYAGTDWEKIGFVEGNGNSSSPKNYSFVDENSAAGKIKYRLKQIDTDGSFEYSQEVEVEVGIPTKFKLFQNYPNPFSKNSGGNSITTIKYSLSNADNVTLKIYNILGAEIATLVNSKQQAGIYNVTFDASKIPSGVYFYSIQSGEKTITKKMLLLR